MKFLIVLAVFIAAAQAAVFIRHPAYYSNYRTLQSIHQIPVESHVISHYGHPLVPSAHEVHNVVRTVSVTHELHPSVYHTGIIRKV